MCFVLWSGGKVMIGKIQSNINFGILKVNSEYSTRLAIEKFVDCNDEVLDAFEKSKEAMGKASGDIRISMDGNVSPRENTGNISLHLRSVRMKKLPSLSVKADATPEEKIAKLELFTKELEKRFHPVNLKLEQDADKVYE